MITSKALFNLLVFIFSYCFLITLVRFLLPYGDEPDFYFRVNSILYEEKTFINPFGYFESLFARFNWLDASVESISMKYFRISWTLSLIFVTGFLSFVFAVIYFKFQSSWNRNEACRSVRILFLTMLFPSVWFHLGFLAEEQFTLLLSLLAILFRRSLIILFFIGFLVLLIDFGNSIVYFFFLLFYLFFAFSLKKYGYFTSFCFFVMFFLLALIVKMEFLRLLSYLPVIGDKAAGIYNDYTNIYDVNNKYPIILRPIITFMSLVLMLPISQTFFFLPYVLVLTFLMIIFRKMMRFFSILNKIPDFYNDFPFFLAGGAMVLYFPIILPGFSNAKYYVFVMPFFILFVSYIVKINRVFYFLLFLNFLVFLQLILTEVFL